jgi:hypothetical protein
MPPHIKTVFRYHNGKFPLAHASAKLLSANGPFGVSEAISGGTPERRDATAIQANGTNHKSAAALTAASAHSQPSALIVNTALDQPERDYCHGKQRGDADYRRSRGQPVS